MIDWNEVAINPVVRRLARILREEFGLWVGIVTDDGQQIAFGGAATPLIRPVCERFMANPIEEAPGEQEVQSCRGSLRRWREEDASGRHDPFKRCHAGLHAITSPVERGGEDVATIYLSGFLPAERAHSALERIEALLEHHELVDHVDEEMLETIPRPPKAQRGCARAIGRHLADVVESQLEPDGDEDDEIRDRYGDMIGSSPAMQRLYETLDKISRSDSTVLIQGENGTGKELIARAIHRGSRRSDMPFIVQNCAALPPHLIESELFGHKKGAFSGAHRDRVGLFEVANHGTFFLDEIGEMALSLQVKLLRVLQEGTFLPVGGNTYRKVDVRIICATNRDLQKLVDEGSFREDLFYRINVITVDAPPLRHRREDISILARHFLNLAAKRHGTSPKTIPDDVIEKLQNHAWPGNVRELENEMERLVILSGDNPELDASLIRLGSTSSETDLGDLSKSSLELPEAVEKLERQMILEGLRRTGWNKTQTARELGVSRRNLIRKVARYDLEKYRTD